MTDMLFTTTPETTHAAAQLDLVSWTFKHKYRTVTAVGAKMHDVRVVYYRHNKMYREKYGVSYGVTDWQHIHEHTSVKTLKEAKALAAQWARAGIAAGYPGR
jgi:hypothetical protein